MATYFASAGMRCPRAVLPAHGRRLQQSPKSVSCGVEELWFRRRRGRRIALGDLSRMAEMLVYRDRRYRFLVNTKSLAAGDWWLRATMPKPPGAAGSIEKMLVARGGSRMSTAPYV